MHYLSSAITCALFGFLHSALQAEVEQKVDRGQVQRLTEFRFQSIPPRPVDVWLPEGFPAAAPYAVLYMQDGQMLFNASTTWNGRSWDVARTAQSLIDSEWVRPFILVSIHNPGPSRHSEYFPQQAYELLDPGEQRAQSSLLRGPDQKLFDSAVYSDRYLAALVEELKPHIDRNFPVDGGRAATAVAGSSMGGLISWYAQLRYPKVFGASASLSTHWLGSFETGDNPLPEAFFEYLRKNLPSHSSGMRFYFDHGDATLDAHYPKLQREADEIFREAGYRGGQFISRFYPGAAHTESAWAERLAQPLMFLFGKPATDEAVELERVEPPFWWSGMAHPVLELMLHGRGIAWLEPEVLHPAVEITAIHRTDNPNYLFIELDLSGLEGEVTLSIQLRRNGAEPVVEFDYQLHQRKTESATRVGFNSSDVIYLLVPDRFANGDPANDNLPGMLETANRSHPDGRHGGDIAGLRAALPHLADLGFTAVWPTPMTENNQPAYSYHGYSATDLYRVDPRFGSNDEFRDLVADARSNGMKFIQDIIVNHIGDQHPWMQDLPAADWINFPRGGSDGGFVPTNHNRSTIQDPYAAEYDRKRFTDGWFVPSMPDLNQRNPRLANYLIQNSIWWVEFAGLSGIREDTYSYADKSFLSEWGRRIMLEYPNFNIVGEEWSTNPLIVSYWQKGKENHDGYVSHTPSMLDFPLYDALLKCLVEPEDWNSGWIRLYEALGNDHVYADPMNLVVFEGNHDTARLFAILNEDVDLLRMALMFLTTTRGIPQLLYGTELAMRSPPHRADGLVRANYPGGWAGDTVNAFTGTGLNPLQSDTIAFVRSLLNWRKSSPAIHHGTLKHFAPFDDCYAFFRTHSKQNVMVIFNKSHQPRTIELSRFDEILDRPLQTTNPLTGESLTLDHELLLQPRSSLLLQWTP